MKNLPLVSVIIPTYNRADKVGDAINSALNQSYKNLEVLVVDDGSTDDTEKTILNFPTVRYIRQQHAGQAAARNNGLHHASGEIIANLDSDDLWGSDFIEDCVHKLETDQLDFVFANWMQQSKIGHDWDFLQNDLFLKPYFPRLKNDWVQLESDDLRNLYLQACPSPSSAVVMRRTSIHKGWDEAIHIGDDWALYIDMILSKKCRAAFTLKKLWRKRIDDINIYDGRSRAEVLDLLYNADISRIIGRHKHHLSKKELMKLNKIHSYSLVELSKHKILREHDIKKAFHLFRKACSISILFSFQAAPQIFFNGIKRQVGNPKLNQVNHVRDQQSTVTREVVAGN